MTIEIDLDLSNWAESEMLQHPKEILGEAGHKQKDQFTPVRLWFTSIW